MMSLSRNIQKPKPATTRGEAGPRCEIGTPPSLSAMPGVIGRGFGSAHEGCLAADRPCS